jgi:hypothetical protein
MGKKDIVKYFAIVLGTGALLSSCVNSETPENPPPRTLIVQSQCALTDIADFHLYNISNNPSNSYGKINNPQLFWQTFNPPDSHMWGIDPEATFNHKAKLHITETCFDSNHPEEQIEVFEQELSSTKNLDQIEIVRNGKNIETISIQNPSN